MSACLLLSQFLSICENLSTFAHTAILVHYFHMGELNPHPKTVFLISILRGWKNEHILRWWHRKPTLVALFTSSGFTFTLIKAEIGSCLFNPWLLWLKGYTRIHPRVYVCETKAATTVWKYYALIVSFGSIGIPTICALQQFIRRVNLFCKLEAASSCLLRKFPTLRCFESLLTFSDLPVFLLNWSSWWSTSELTPVEL